MACSPGTHQWITDESRSGTPEVRQLCVRCGASRVEPQRLSEDEDAKTALARALTDRPDLVLGKNVSKQAKVMEAARTLGRHLHCPYCDTRTVAPDSERYVFACTSCRAEWATDGKELRGPTAHVECQACGSAKLVPLGSTALLECPACRSRFTRNGERHVCPRHGAQACGCPESAQRRAAIAAGVAPAAPGERFVDLGEDE